MTNVEAWTLFLVILAGLLQGGGLAWAWTKARRNARVAREELEGALSSGQGSGLTWAESDFVTEQQKVHRAEDALDSYRIQGVMVLTGIVVGMVAGALPLIAG